MTKYSLLQKMEQTLEVKKNRLKQLESHIKNIKRKTRTRRLIELGGLVAKAGLEDLESNALLGGLLHLKQLVTDPKIEEEFAHQGGKEFAKENQNKSLVIVKFDEKPNNEIRAKIRELGLKWNAIRQEWQGYAEWQKLDEFLAGYSAEITHVKEAYPL
ncbi:MAG: conjugal transfer protein TraD [Caedimonadaceae bacterium]|nr:MAG: conjugal transfer protein TraD [Caedimonadaceae bacterium]